MGFLDKLKSIKNAITGGSAKVYVEVGDTSLREPFIIKIKAQTEDAPVKINKVYLLIKGMEEIEVPDVDLAYDEEGELQRRCETVRRESTTVDLELNVSGPEELEENGQFEWECEVTLPPNALPTFRGIHAEHSYAVQAGLDCFGNDPDSGWLEIEIY